MHPPAAEASAGCADEAHVQAKRRALLAGLAFIRSLGAQLLRSETLAARHGADILIPFFVPLAGMAASDEEQLARQVASELAAAWHARARARALPPTASPSALLDLMQGIYSLEGVGRTDALLRQQLAERAARFGAVDFFRYDPRQGDPPRGLNEDCACGAKVARHALECAACRRAAVPMSQFDVWLEALVWSFHGCRMRIGLGCCFFEILRQIGGAFAKFYPKRSSLSRKELHYLCYALTHVIFTLNNFDERRLSPSLFPESVPAFMREQLVVAMNEDDPDMAGELLDCLKCLGEKGSHIQAAERFLLRSQSKLDGGWVCKGEADLFSRYHASLVAVAALLDHSYAGCAPVFEGAAEVLPEWFVSTTPIGEPSPSYTKPISCTLCDVDHTHEQDRQQAQDAVKASKTMAIQWPLPQQHKKTVALLPVMHRMQIREKLLADKVQQQTHTLRQKIRDADFERFVCGGSSAARIISGRGDGDARLDSEAHGLKLLRYASKHPPPLPPVRHTSGRSQENESTSWSASPRRHDLEQRRALSNRESRGTLKRQLIR